MKMASAMLNTNSQPATQEKMANKEPNNSKSSTNIANKPKKTVVVSTKSSQMLPQPVLSSSQHGEVATPHVLAKPPPHDGFNKEALEILREMNKNIMKGNDRVEMLSGRLDNWGNYDDNAHYVDYDDEQYDESYVIDSHDTPSCSQFADGANVEECDASVQPSVFDKFAKTFRKADTVSDPIDEQLADLVNETFRDGMSDDNLNELLRDIHRPSNCDGLKEIKVHSAVWAILKQNTQMEDSKLRVIQNCILKATANLVKLLDKHAGSFDQHSLELGMNSLGLLGQSCKWLSMRRKDVHKRDMDPKLHHLCSASSTTTDVLYGDTSTIVKDIKDIQEMNKISRSVAGKAGGYGYAGYNQRRPTRGGARFMRGARRGPYQYGARRGRGNQAFGAYKPPKNGQRAEKKN